MKTKQSGGKRLGSGRPFKFGEETKSITIRVPKSREADFKKQAEKILESYLQSPK